jgi:hypothetical protein
MSKCVSFYPKDAGRTTRVANLGGGKFQPISFEE